MGRPRKAKPYRSMSTRYFIYRKQDREIVTYCDKKMAQDLLDRLDPARLTMGIGWKQIIHHLPGFAGDAVSITFSYPDSPENTEHVTL